jgi:hypothetical protein
MTGLLFVCVCCVVLGVESIALFLETIRAVKLTFSSSPPLWAALVLEVVGVCAAAIGIFTVIILNRQIPDIGRRTWHVAHLLKGLTEADRLADECLWLFGNEMRVLLDPIREVIDEIQETYGRIELRVIVAVLRQRAQILKCEGDPEGIVINDVAGYLGSLYYTPAGDKFDRAVYAGASALALIEDLLAW